MHYFRISIYLNSYAMIRSSRYRLIRDVAERSTTKLIITILKYSIFDRILYY